MAVSEYDLVLALNCVRKCGVRWHGVGTYWLSTDRADLIELPTPVVQCAEAGTAKLTVVFPARRVPGVEVAHVYVESAPPGQHGMRVARVASACLRWSPQIAR